MATFCTKKSWSECSSDADDVLALRDIDLSTAIREDNDGSAPFGPALRLGNLCALDSATADTAVWVARLCGKNGAS